MHEKYLISMKFCSCKLATKKTVLLRFDASIEKKRVFRLFIFIFTSHCASEYRQERFDSRGYLGLKQITFYRHQNKTKTIFIIPGTCLRFKWQLANLIMLPNLIYFHLAIMDICATSFGLLCSESLCECDFFLGFCLDFTLS